MYGRNRFVAVLFTLTSAAVVMPALAADVWVKGGVLMAGSGVPASYPSIGTGPVPRDNAANYRARTPKAAPSVGQVSSPNPRPQRQMTALPATAQPPVQVILPEQLLGLLDIAFERFDARRAEAPEANGPAIASGVDAEQSLLALALVRNLISSVNQANMTNDYSVLWAQMTRPVQALTSPADMAAQLKPLRDINFDLTETLVAQPSIQSRLTEVDGVPVLVAQGEFPDAARKVSFAGEFQQNQGRWQVQNFRVDVSPLATPAPEAGN
jgi:hypothetical protein